MFASNARTQGHQMQLGQGFKTNRGVFSRDKMARRATLAPSSFKERAQSHREWPNHHLAAVPLHHPHLRLRPRERSLCCVMHSTRRQRALLSPALSRFPLQTKPNRSPLPGCSKVLVSLALSHQHDLLARGTNVPPGGSSAASPPAGSRGFISYSHRDFDQDNSWLCPREVCSKILSKHAENSN